ncbi:hypothetical protein DNU06_07100 [Putridiphycobacter roseus]|uniref:TonB-dependent receptor-like beta-barrel domain-containing protein n=1 Tax=Putridiphycobacter roseus TaxID=2219161 RepID=A0A2W1MZE1_9FLAO|nr:hypothetical protein [Putridiphycobacter roseus]PZE17589.1 hypothetical protein DNU06_07100 [Putridiphycobacter roseus]
MKKKCFLLFFLYSQIGLFAQDKFTTLNFEELKNYDEIDGFFNDSLIKDYAVFFTGENHAYADVNAETEFKMLVYLHEKHKVNHFLFEQGPAIGYIINKITLENNLDFGFYLKDRFYEAYFKLVKNITKYNESQPDSLKIITHGIDVERFPAYAIFALNQIVDSISTVGETGRIYESIKALGTSEFKDGMPDDIYNSGGTRFNLNGNVIDAWSTFNTIIYDVNRLTDSLKIELGEEYPIFKDIIESLEEGHQWYHEERNGDLTGPITRERFMIGQFDKLTKRYDQPKFYGQFGRCHLHSNKKAKRCYSYDMASIAKRIGELQDGFYKDKVLTIPMLYKSYNSYDKSMIESLGLDYRFDLKNKMYLIDIDYLKGNNPLVGFSNTIQYVFVNTYNPSGFEEEYDFNVHLEEVHVGAAVGVRYLNKLNGLNFELVNAGVGTFATSNTIYSIGLNYYDLNATGMHLSYDFMPAISNGDRFTLSAKSFTFGNSYPMGNEFFLFTAGLKYTYGMYYLLETTSNLSPNLIQSDAQNVTVYKNDVFLLDPNVEIRFTLPLISINARAGYSFDVSGKYWKLDGKMRDFTKTSFTSPYFMIGASLNFKSKY